MSDTFTQILHDYRDFVIFLVATAVLVILLVKFWDRISLWALNLVYSLPLIGRVSMLSRDITRTDGEWYRSERTLCSAYGRHVKLHDRREFLECQRYLEKAGDAGRKPLPTAMRIVLVGLVVAEALGFSYVLAGWTIPGASENLQVQGSYVIAFALSAALVLLTHHAGHELHRNRTIRRAQMEWSQDGGSNSFVSANAPSLGTSLSSEERPQSLDDHEPRYAQLLSRVGTHPSYLWATAAVVFVVVVAVLATYVRIQTFELQETEATIATGDPYYSASPPELAEVQSAADTKAQEDVSSTRRAASTSTFILLAVLFVFLQIIGVLFGMNWGFAGIESTSAYKRMGGGKFLSFDEYKAFYYDRVCDAAQSKLDSLRQKMQHRASKHGKRLELTSKSFVQFLADDRARNRFVEASAPPRAAQPAAPAPAPTPAPAATPPAPATASGPLVPPPTATARPLTAPPPVVRYFYTNADGQACPAPVSWRELEQLFATNIIGGDTYVNQEHTTEWLRFAEVRAARAGAGA